MFEVTFTPDAWNDLESIADYTDRRYGFEQCIAYQESLTEAFSLIAENPFIGSDQSDIRFGVRRFVRERHAIYYRVLDNEILVLRILGPGQDPLTNLT